MSASYTQGLTDENGRSLPDRDDDGNIILRNAIDLPGPDQDVILKWKSATGFEVWRYSGDLNMARIGKGLDWERYQSEGEKFFLSGNKAALKKTMEDPDISPTVSQYRGKYPGLLDTNFDCFTESYEDQHGVMQTRTVYEGDNRWLERYSGLSKDLRPFLLGSTERVQGTITELPPAIEWFSHSDSEVGYYLPLPAHHVSVNYEAIGRHLWVFHGRLEAMLSSIFPEGVERLRKEIRDHKVETDDGRMYVNLEHGHGIAFKSTMQFPSVHDGKQWKKSFQLIINTTDDKPRNGNARPRVIFNGKDIRSVAGWLAPLVLQALQLPLTDQSLRGVSDPIRAFVTNGPARWTQDDVIGPDANIIPRAMIHKQKMFGAFRDPDGNWRHGAYRREWLPCLWGVPSVFEEGSFRGVLEGGPIKTIGSNPAWFESSRSDKRIEFASWRHEIVQPTAQEGDTEERHEDLQNWTDEQGASFRTDVRDPDIVTRASWKPAEHTKWSCFILGKTLRSGQVIRLRVVDPEARPPADDDPNDMMTLFNQGLPETFEKDRNVVVNMIVEGNVILTTDGSFNEDGTQRITGVDTSHLKLRTIQPASLRTSCTNYVFKRIQQQLAKGASYTEERCPCIACRFDSLNFDVIKRCSSEVKIFAMTRAEDPQPESDARKYIVIPGRSQLRGEVLEGSMTPGLIGTPPALERAASSVGTPPTLSHTPTRENNRFNAGLSFEYRPLGASKKQRDAKSMSYGDPGAQHNAVQPERISRKLLMSISERERLTELLTSTDEDDRVLYQQRMTEFVEQYIDMNPKMGWMRHYSIGIASDSQAPTECLPCHVQLNLARTGTSDGRNEDGSVIYDEQGYAIQPAQPGDGQAPKHKKPFVTSLVQLDDESKLAIDRAMKNKSFNLDFDTGMLWDEQMWKNEECLPCIPYNQRKWVKAKDGHWFLSEPRCRHVKNIRGRPRSCRNSHLCNYCGCPRDDGSGIWSRVRWYWDKDENDYVANPSFRCYNNCCPDRLQCPGAKSGHTLRYNGRQ